jgi:hypothetical protein
MLRGRRAVPKTATYTERCGVRLLTLPPITFNTVPRERPVLKVARWENLSGCKRHGAGKAVK